MKRFLNWLDSETLGASLFLLSLISVGGIVLYAGLSIYIHNI